MPIVAFSATSKKIKEINLWENNKLAIYNRGKLLQQYSFVWKIKHQYVFQYLERKEKLYVK